MMMMMMIMIMMLLLMMMLMMMMMMDGTEEKLKVFNFVPSNNFGCRNLYFLMMVMIETMVMIVMTVMIVIKVALRSFLRICISSGINFLPASNHRHFHGRHDHFRHT